jgi:ACT domain-containing protein
MIPSRAGYVKAGKHMSFKSKKKMPMVFSTQEAIEYMGIGRDTFYRYRDLLGIIPRKMYGVRGRFYLIHEIIEMMELRLPNVKQYRAHVLDRLAVRKQKGREQP